MQKLFSITSMNIQSFLSKYLKYSNGLFKSHLAYLLKGLHILSSNYCQSLTTWI